MASSSRQPLKLEILVSTTLQTQLNYSANPTLLIYKPNSTTLQTQFYNNLHYKYKMSGISLESANLKSLVQGIVFRKGQSHPVFPAVQPQGTCLRKKVDRNVYTWKMAAIPEKKKIM